MDIIDMNLMWFWIHLLYTVSFTASMKCDDVKFDTTCSDDCSQPARFTGANDTFFCKILLQEGLKVFKEKNRILLENATIAIDAPKLTSVDYYLKPYLVTGSKDVRWNPSLNISFQLPDGFIALGPKTGREYLLKGVLVNFTSVENLHVQDVYYHDCPKYRLFNFSAYRPTYYDSENPRIIKYDCFVGLDENDSRVYMIGLQSLPGTGITYYVTTYNQRQVWKPAIAVAFRNATALHVVYEQAPFIFENYELELFMSIGYSWTSKDTTPAQTILKLPADNSHSFEVVKGGHYFVQVSVIGNKSACPDECVSKSWIINTSSLVFSTAENQSWLDENHRILAAIVGCLAGILLVMLLLYMLWKKKAKSNSKCGGWRKPSVLVVYSYECSEFDNLVQSFAKHIRDKWDIDVYLDLWEETQNQGIGESWCSEKLRSVDFLLCICSQGWIETFDNGKVLSSHRQHNEYFKYAVDEVERMRSRPDNHCPEILTIYFDFMKCPVPSALKNHPGSYMLMPSSKKLFCHLHNVKNVPRKFNRAVDGLALALQGEINKAKIFFRNNPEWILRRIKDKSVIPEPNGKMFISEKSPSSTESKKIQNSEIKYGKPLQSDSEYQEFDKILKALNEDPDEEFNGSDNDVIINDHDNKAILTTGSEDENMESPSALPLYHPDNLRYNGNNVKPCPHNSQYCRIHSPDHHRSVKNSESIVSEEHASLLPDQKIKRTSQPGDFKRKIHHENNLLNHHHINHYPGSPPHAHHKVYPPSQPFRPPAEQKNGKTISCNRPFSSRPDESALFGDPEHESKYYPHHHRDVLPDECPSLGQSQPYESWQPQPHESWQPQPHESWQPQSLVDYEENIVPSFKTCVANKISSPFKTSHCAKHKDVRDSNTVQPFIDYADSYHDQISFHRMQHLNSKKSRLDPQFVDYHQKPYNGHQRSHFAHQNPVQFERPIMFDQPHSIEIAGLSGERYPLHPESETSYFSNDDEDGELSFVESQSSLNKQKMYKQNLIPVLSETVPTNKFLHGNSHVSHPQKKFVDKNMRSNLYHHNQLQVFKKGVGDVPEENDLLLIPSFPSKTLLDTHSRLNCYAEIENQSSNKYQINLQHEEIDEEFVPPEDLSGSDGEREKSKPVSESVEFVMEELAGLNQSESFEMENYPVERPSSIN
ncbi:hypothetical protein ACJMK2_016582 [Sinanodonta woodiana]|uniref:SEFIR domain-containing protein n=1 Tax=Sinanodonta woodiana TaxID=1069815 RepID=A0ABD3UXH7_SINWO